MKIFLDTNAIIYFLEEDPQFYNQVMGYFERAERGEWELYTSSLSYMEVLIPVVKLGNVALEAKYNYLFKHFFRVVNTDLEVARAGAVIKAKYGIKTPDALQVGAPYRCPAKSS
jgi:predicted nucleic acid-binding protein